MRLRFLRIVFFGAVLAMGSTVYADVRIVVPFPAGGPLDLVARVVGTELRNVLNTPVIVENRSGAGGTIGTRQVASAAPDGTTIVLATLGSQVIAPLLGNDAGYHPSKSFDTLALAGIIQIGLVVRPDLPVKDLAGLMALAGSGKSLSYGTAGVGTTTHIAAETLNARVGGKLTHVPYRGGGPAVTDLMGGHIDLYTGDIPTLATYIKANSVLPLAVLDTSRSDLFPDVPTTVELGYPDMVMNNWYGFLAPHGLKADVRTRLEKGLLTVLNMPGVQKTLLESGVKGPMGAAQFEKILNEEVNRWPPFIKERGITQ